MFVFFVYNTRVVFIFFLFFFCLCFCVRSEKGDLLAIGRPGKIFHAALSFGQGAGFSAVRTHCVDLLVFVAIGKESELFAVG